MLEYFVLVACCDTVGRGGALQRREGLDALDAPTGVKGTQFNLEIGVSHLLEGDVGIV